MEKIYNGITYELVENPHYKRSKDCYECKYRVMYYDDYYGSWRILYHCENKRQFTLKRIVEELMYR